MTFILLPQGSGLFERLHEACKQDDLPAAGRSTAVAHLKVQDRDSLQRPQFLVLCCVSGLPVDQVMQQLVAQHSDSLGRIVTCTTRKPMVSHDQQCDAFRQNKSQLIWHACRHQAY